MSPKETKKVASTNLIIFAVGELVLQFLGTLRGLENCNRSRYHITS